ncbi:hypothetical protein AMJ83_06215 [candidate division WOR_3 bacterium SM23_42]|uniref:Secretion system C-terminal sorting domain-containing protein n=1 Tax=candidate division WOR_3 bacterium SM23_42 TaxID=1703779 RepID=A0A0S8FSB6_UNCW3|nr:MAG: hypothetical protein AMJ83_06215 [candidate division WOR_3 bacterium SM23_42]
MKLRINRARIIVVLSSIITFVVADVSMPSSPMWQADYGNIPTGVGWGDIDGNGWHDLVITNGCDAAFVPNHVYFNNGSMIPTSPGWVSADQEPSDNIAIVDLDHDGDLDLVVANLGYTPTGCPPLPHVIYQNDGGLSPSPTWYSQPGNSFSCAVGDPDGDGDHDIAFAQGDYLTGHLQKAVIYRNNDGVIDTLPYWQSDSSYYGVEAFFVDIDFDGDHDFALGGRNAYVSIFYNDAGILETTPSWQTHAIIGARQMDFGDVDGDGDLDLAVAGIAEDFFLFENLGGHLDTVPFWSCSNYTQPSCVAWADVDDDGDFDLAGGAWYAPVGIFENNGGVLSDSYVWSYTGGGWLQQIAWGDFDEDGLVVTSEAFLGDGDKRIFYLERKPVHEISSLYINGTPVALQEYCHDFSQGWISLATAPATDDTLTVNYTYSQDLDLAVTGSRAMLFDNQHITAISEDETHLPQDSYCGPTIITGGSSLPRSTEYKIYDISGREVRAEHIEPGIYFIKLGNRVSRKIVKIK